VIFPAKRASGGRYTKRVWVFTRRGGGFPGGEGAEKGEAFFKGFIKE
jgi:hypothetical protein